MADSELLDQIRSAPDLGALDALRVSALGKSGSITAQLKSLGKMSPEERTAATEIACAQALPILRQLAQASRAASR